MSHLKKLSRKKEKEPKTQPVSTRLTDYEFQQFYILCEETGYSISEALRILVQQEIKGNEDEMFTKRIQNNTERLQENTESKQKSYNASTFVDKPSTFVNKQIRKSSFSRFTTSEWNVDNSLPCPICNGWISANNFSRHAKNHDMTTQEIFEKHKEEADKMVKERSR